MSRLTSHLQLGSFGDFLTVSVEELPRCTHGWSHRPSASYLGSSLACEMCPVSGGIRIHIGEESAITNQRSATRPRFKQG